MRWKLLLAIFAGLLMILLVSIPHIAEWYLEKHDQELLGREVEVDDLDINIFTGKLGIENLRVLEADRQSDFLSCRDGKVYFSWWKLFSDDIYIRGITLDGLQVNIIQNGEQFNFDDLLPSPSEDTLEQEEPKKYVWHLDSMLLSGAGIKYQDVLVGSELALDSITFISRDLSSQSPLYNAYARLMMDEGALEATLNIDADQSLYTLQSNIAQFPFAAFQPYLEHVIKLSTFDSHLDANILLSGSYTQADSFALSGDMHVRDFVMVDEQQDSLIAWADFSLEVDSLDTRKQIYDFGDIRMLHPYIRLVNSTEGDNFTRALVNPPSQDSLATKDSLTVQPPTDTLKQENSFQSPFEFLAKTLYDVSQEYLFVNYLADSIAIDEGVLDYYDYTLQDSFYMELSQLSALATDIKEGDQYAHFDIRALLDRTGNLVADLEVSRSGVDNMLFNFKVDNVYLSNFNPYSKYYVAYPFVDGKVIFSSKNSIKDYFLTSDNNLFVEEIAVGEKDTANALNELPMKLAVALLRDLQGNVDLDVPVEGQLNDPKYKFWRAILQVLKNILLKVVTAPYRLLANAIGGDPKDLKSVTFADLQYDIQQEQARRLKNVAKVLKKKPEFNINFVSVSDSVEEKSALALAEGWSDYQSSLGMVSQDSLLIAPGLNSLDSSFFYFIQQSLPSIDSVYAENIVAACMELTGEAQVNALYQQLWQKRQDAVRDYLLEVEGLNEDRWLFVEKTEAPADTTITQPQFLIEYHVE